MEHVILRIVRTIEYNKGWHDEPSRCLVIEDVLPSRREEHVVGTSNHYCRWYVERKASYTGDIGGTTSVGNVDAVLGNPFGGFCPRLVSLPAQWNVPLSTLLNAEQCECLWHDLARLLFVGETFGELPEDNSSFAGVSTSPGMMSSFPLSRAVRCLA